jgi:hypothetical protein
MRGVDRVDSPGFVGVWRRLLGNALDSLSNFGRL